MLFWQLRLFTANLTINPEAGCEVLVSVSVFDAGFFTCFLLLVDSIYTIQQFGALQQMPVAHRAALVCCSSGLHSRNQKRWIHVQSTKVRSRLLDVSMCHKRRLFATVLP